MPSTEKDLTLLSSYIDGQLTERERASLETRLKADGALRADLESLRATVALLKQAERVRVPRNFTLDPKAYGKPARPSLWDQLGLSFAPLASAASMIAVVMILGGGFVLAANANLGPISGAAAPASDTAMIAPEQMPFAAGAAPAESAAETEAMTQMIAEATEEAPQPEAASGEAQPAGGAGGGITTSPTAVAAAPPSIVPAPSDNMRTADSASANSTTGGDAPQQPGIAPSTPKMGEQDDTGLPDEMEQAFGSESRSGQPFTLSLPLLGGGLIALGLAILAVVLVTRRK